ncbi:ArsR/SmtB family transcription factor [Actinoplanes sp. NPDC051343]|uniref:ArsR/SmtB family transcription factor n=1 Tax=Actinoplanes sp. NPDC051343 TaxID=3363906 RepID=UPI003793394A
MTLLRLSPRALTRCRFAVSPLAETVGTLLNLERLADPRFRRWRDRSPARRGLFDLSARTKYLPDPLAVPPDGGLRTKLSDELALVAGFSDFSVRDSVRLAEAASWGDRPDISWASADGLAKQIAEDLAEAWELFVRPDWPRRRAVLERDIAYRTELLAAEGWRAVVATIARNTSWATDDAIAFGRPGHPDRIIDDGIIFAPHTEGTGTWTCEFPPPRFAMTYPARGRAADVDPAAGADLARLIGDGRARVLLELRVPATSTELARILGVSLGTVSAHLAGLRSAGVITGVRSGRTVRYRLDPRGWDLLAAFGVPVSSSVLDQARSSGADGFRS